MTQFTLHRASMAGIALFTGLMCTAPQSFAASNVSSEYDGRYGGAMTPASDANPDLCPAKIVTDFVIRGGAVKAPAKISNTDFVIFDGFVTAEGFVTGHFRVPGGPLNDFEGRMVQETGTTMLSGGLTESQSGCAYLLELRKTIQP